MNTRLIYVVGLFAALLGACSDKGASRTDAADSHPQMCTGACPTDAGQDGGDAGDGDAGVTCTDNGVTYQVGQTIPRGPCNSCRCLANGTVGQCTGVACPDGSSGG